MFITLEGGEGTGKSTQARLLADRLATDGYPVLRTREPGGSPGAEALRELLLHRSPVPGGWAPLAETMLHFAARADHATRTLRPALASGLVVVCDRFTDSTVAYQGYGQGADQAGIAQLAGLIGLRPDLTLILAVPRDEARRRLAARDAGPGDRYERFDEAFHERVAQGYRRIAAAEPGRCVEISAAGPVERVAALVWDAVRQRLPAPQP